MCDSFNEMKYVVRELQGERRKSVKNRTMYVNTIFIIFFIFTLFFRFNWFPFLVLSHCQFAMHVYIGIYIYIYKDECYVQNNNTIARGAEINSKVLTVLTRSMQIIFSHSVTSHIPLGLTNGLVL